MTILSENLTDQVIKLFAMNHNSQDFHILFKRLRLKAEFSTLSELGSALAEKGLIYEDSIFSHWQKGTRFPHRGALLCLIQIFTEKQSLNSIHEANQFLETAGEGYLTKDELETIKFSSTDDVPFQIPSQIDNFSGREDLIKRIQSDFTPGNLIIIYGPPGVGKTSLAIQLGYLLKEVYSDGVLWFRLDTSDVMDIFLAIAYAFGKDIGHIRDRETRASIIKTILANKKVLLIFDNVEFTNDIRLLLPNTRYCSIIITSRHSHLSIFSKSKNISLENFSKYEAISLFKKVLGGKYTTTNNTSILRLADKIGYLPLALHIFAKEIKENSLDIVELLEKIERDLLSLEELSYDDRNLYVTIDLSYKLLDIKTRKLFTSLAVFDGKDFSIESVGYINDLSLSETKKFLNKLREISLIQESSKNRYRIHPLIKRFIRNRFGNADLILKAARYYQQFLAKFDKTFLKSYPNIKQESDNVLYVFKKCYELHYWDEVIALWNPLEFLLDATNQQDKMRYLFQVVKTQQPGLNIFQKALIAYFIFLILYYTFLFFLGFTTSVWNYLYSLLFGLIPLFGSIVGLLISKSWGLFKSAMGRAVLFLSLGLLTWAIGNLIFAYYNFVENISAPYPSFADVGYIISYILWMIGMINLPHAIGGKFGLKKWYGKLLIVLIPLFVLAFSYYLIMLITKSNLILVHTKSYIKLFFDIAYPASDAVILSIALILGTSYKFFGGKFKLSVYAILLGFCFQYVADFLFSYTTTVNFFYPGGFVDLIFTMGLFLLTFGLLGFYFPSKKNSS